MPPEASKGPRAQLRDLIRTSYETNEVMRQVPADHLLLAPIFPLTIAAMQNRYPREPIRQQCFWDEDMAFPEEVEDFYQEELRRLELQELRSDLSLAPRSGDDISDRYTVSSKTASRYISRLKEAGVVTSPNKVSPGELLKLTDQYKPKLTRLAKVIVPSVLAGKPRRPPDLDLPPPLKPAVFVERNDEQGRDTMEVLDAAWKNRETNIVSIVAGRSGEGKTALVRRWILEGEDRGSPKGFDTCFAWSSFLHSGEGSPVDSFFKEALKHFGDEGDGQEDNGDPADRLAAYLNEQRTLLVIDGFEVFLNPSSGSNSEIQDADMRRFINKIALAHRGMCIITSKKGIKTLEDRGGDTTIQVRLSPLSPEAGASLLSRLLDGSNSDEKLREVSEEYDGNCLALTLLATYVNQVYKGEIRYLEKTPQLLETPDGGEQATRMIAAYGNWFEQAQDGLGREQLSILRVLSVIGRPVRLSLVKELARSVEVDGVTRALQSLGVSKWRQALKLLSDAALIQLVEHEGQEFIQTHQLITEYFAAGGRERHPDGWERLHEWLFQYYSQTAGDSPETSDGLIPLYRAVNHACKAGLYAEAWDQVFYPRIRRGDDKFSLKNLGLISSDLEALGGFFGDSWDHLEDGVHEIESRSPSYVVSEAGFCLLATGRLEEASVALRSALRMRQDGGEWVYAARNANNLFWVSLARGQLDEAMEHVKMGLDFLEKASAGDEGDPEFIQTVLLANLAAAYHHKGQRAIASELFRRAEKLESDRDGGYERLWSVRGYLYHDLLLDLAQSPELLSEIEGRAKESLEWAREHSPLSRALPRLTLARIELEEYLEMGDGDLDRAAKYARKAIEGIENEAQARYFVPQALCTAAMIHRIKGNLAKANDHLQEMLAVVTRPNETMRIQKVEYHIEACNVCMSRGNGEGARSHLREAQSLIDGTGYFRRQEDVETLLGELGIP